MKRIILPAVFVTGAILYSCGNADKVAQHVLDSMMKDSTDKAVAKADSIHQEDSIFSASKKMHQDWLADSARKADSLKNKGKK